MQGIDTMLRGKDFADAGDEWLVVHLQATLDTKRVMRFAAGFSAECYLKAAIARLWHPAEEANKAAREYSHELAPLIKACRRLIPGFLPDLVINDRFLSVEPWYGHEKQSFSAAERHEFLWFREFYVINRYLKDLKYMAGLPSVGWKSSGTFTDGGVYPNPFWPRLLGEMRLQARGDTSDGGVFYGLRISRFVGPELMRQVDDVIHLRHPRICWTGGNNKGAGT